MWFKLFGRPSMGTGSAIWYMRESANFEMRIISVDANISSATGGLSDNDVSLVMIECSMTYIVDKELTPPEGQLSIEA